MALRCIIRKGRHNDLPSIVGLLKVLFSLERDFTVDELKQHKGLEMILENDDSSCIIVAEINKQVVGMCTAQLLISTAEGGPVAVIEDVVVEEAYRRMGIGKGLLLAIESWAAEKGVKRLQLLADRNNIPALKFYDKMGWNNTRLICLHKK
ncbi:MAG: GNAT family N-acetyltransferase [Peptococcaceae bacterium]